MDDGLRKTLLASRIVEIDKVTISPNERAAFIHGVLLENAPELTVWDKIAGFSELLGSYVEVEPALEDVIKPLLKRVYTLHYFHGKELGSCLTKSNLHETPKSDSTVDAQLKLMAPSDQL
jgi:hypothetical protein